jgi:hypothetical protein
MTDNYAFSKSLQVESPQSSWINPNQVESTEEYYPYIDKQYNDWPPLTWIPLSKNWYISHA